jgi:predicted transcriptional regulator of viral defense system
MSAQRTLAEVAQAVPRGTICLRSALEFHRLTTQAVTEVWIALDVHALRPRSTPFPVRTVYFSGAALTEGAKTHKIDGVPVQIYSPAKTMADCFKYRNKIGTEIAVEALKDYLKQHPRCADAPSHRLGSAPAASLMR